MRCQACYNFISGHAGLKRGEVSDGRTRNTGEIQQEQHERGENISSAEGSSPGATPEKEGRTATDADGRENTTGKEQEEDVRRTDLAKRKLSSTGMPSKTPVLNIDLDHDAVSALGITQRGSIEKDGADTLEEKPRQRKRRVVPGSLVLSSISASDLPDTEKGMFSKQVERCFSP